MHLIEDKYIIVDNVQYTLENKVQFKADTEKQPITLYFSEFNNNKGRLEYDVDGEFKILDNLTLDAFKSYIVNYDDILQEMQLLQVNKFNEPRYLDIDSELVEQIEPSQAFIKNELLVELNRYYQECKNISIIIDSTTVTHFFDNSWRNNLHTKISSLLIARAKGESDTFTWLANDVFVTLTIEKLEKLLYEVEEKIIQLNYHNLHSESTYINNNAVALDYDYKKKFLHSQIIHL